MDYLIEKCDEGKCIRTFVKEKLKISAKLLTKLKKLEDGIMLSGKRVTVRAILKDGDVLTLNIEHEQNINDKIVASDTSVDIIFEDEYYIALNKPPFMPTHPSHNHYDDTLANAVAGLYKRRNTPFVFRAINRLDKNTSGVVIFAKSADSANKLSKLHQNKLIDKEYLAIAEGICNESGIIDGYIKRVDGSVMLREFSKDKTSESHQYCNTIYKKLANSDSASLLSVKITTGRTHQIRVSFSYIGHHIIGDDLYSQDTYPNRHMLHCSCISFIHPYTKKQIFLKSPIPDDFKNVMIMKGIEYDTKDI